MNLDLTSLFPDLEALTPDGRWAMLQNWLANNPEYGERIAGWSTQSVDQVFVEIRDLIAKRFGVSTNLVSLLTVGREQQIKRMIEILQACYRERAGNHTEKEIKNVSTRMDNGRDKQRAVGKRSGKNPRGKTTRTKRTDQA